MENRDFRVTPFISFYGFAHMAVDAACAFLMLAVLRFSDSNAIIAMLTYNSIAFVLQAPLGLLIDKVLNPKYATGVGLVLVAGAFIFSYSLFAALILAGIGNALFHVGGGSQVLSLESRHATFASIFVAPGAIGLAIGGFLAKSQLFIPLLSFPLLLFVLAAITYFVNTPAFNRTKEQSARVKSSFAILLILLIMIPIAVRSAIGMTFDFPWKSNQHLYVTLVAALALGKVLGGILADKYGLMIVGVGGLLLSTPLLAFYPTVPLLGIIGGVVFNFTMPVTLIALLNVMPDKKGLSFGLSTVALFIGSLPSLLGSDTWLRNEYVVLASIILAALFLFVALRLFKRKTNV
jgi:MFS transporter, FSR family, fosmidomycin resistance protein